jgi:hypothetical protein
LVFATTGFAVAAIPGPAGVIHGCLHEEDWEPPGTSSGQDMRPVRKKDRLEPGGAYRAPGRAGSRGNSGDERRQR